MPAWDTFVGLTGVILTLLLALAYLSQSAVRGDDSETVSTPTRTPLDAPKREFPAHAEQDPPPGPGGHPPSHPSPHPGDPPGGIETLSTGALLVNVAFTQGVFGALVIASAWYTGIPAWAFGITADPLSSGLPGLAVGTGLGIGLYVGNELGAASADTMGVEHDERLRSLLAPDSVPGWLTLFLVILPIIAGVEELLFRAAVIGVTAAGFGTSPWALAVVSSLAFAFGHGAQGRLGVIVTGGLGMVLASAFILTGSLLVVVVAHYLVNALEFAVHELLGIDWTRLDV